MYSLKAGLALRRIVGLHRGVRKQQIQCLGATGCAETLNLLLSIPGINVNIRDSDDKITISKACEIKFNLYTC